VVAALLVTPEAVELTRATAVGTVARPDRAMQLWAAVVLVVMQVLGVSGAITMASARPALAEGVPEVAAGLAVLAAAAAAALAFWGKELTVPLVVSALAATAALAGQKVVMVQQLLSAAPLYRDKRLVGVFMAEAKAVGSLRAEPVLAAQSASSGRARHAHSHRLIQGTYKCQIIPAYGRSPSSFKVAVRDCGHNFPARQPLARLRLVSITARLWRLLLPLAAFRRRSLTRPHPHRVASPRQAQRLH
jgi:hypothetical protein